VEPSLKRADVELAQRVRCSACDAFVDLVNGVRGSTWERERRLRHFYTVFARGHLRASGVGIRFDVPLGFFPGVFNGCGRWLVDHLADEKVGAYPEEDPLAHLAAQSLPPGVPLLIQDVDFDRRVGHDAVVTVCAELLGISRQQVYAQLA
jgi:hypothetical protein